MKKNLYAIVFTFGLSALALSACGQNAQSPRNGETPSETRDVPSATQEETGSQASEAFENGSQAEPAADTQASESSSQAEPAADAQAPSGGGAQAPLPAARQQDSDTGARENSAAPADSSSGSQASLPADGLSEEEAKAAALEHAGVAEAEVTGMLVKLEKDDGILQYDVEFYAGDMEYDYEINAATGEILGFDHEWDHDHPHSHSHTGASGSGSEGAQFTREQAVALALSQVSGAGQEHITKFKTDYDDGRLVYEIEIRYNNTECELEIDANTGQILELDFDD